MKISVIIPCYYSTQSLSHVVEESLSILIRKPQYDYEIILVNDGSEDDTYRTIIELAENPKVKGINLSRNFGQPSATMAGFAHCTGDIIVYSDDDGQTPIDSLWALIDELDKGYDIVFADFVKKKNSLFQNFGTKVNNLMAYFLIGKPKHLHFGNFWVCKRFVIDEVLKCKNPYPYLGGLFVKTTLNMGQVTTSHRDRLYGKTTYTFTKMLSLWLNGFTAFSVKPLRLASLTGVLCAGIGFVYGVKVIVDKFIYPEILVGYSSLMAVILFIGGILMLLLGLIGEYVGRIYMNINSIPQYVVRDKVNLEHKK